MSSYSYVMESVLKSNFNLLLRNIQSLTILTEKNALTPSLFADKQSDNLV